MRRETAEKHGAVPAHFPALNNRLEQVTPDSAFNSSVISSVRPRIPALLSIAGGVRISVRHHDGVADAQAHSPRPVRFRQHWISRDNAPSSVASTQLAINQHAIRPDAAAGGFQMQTTVQIHCVYFVNRTASSSDASCEMPAGVSAGRIALHTGDGPTRMMSPPSSFAGSRMRMSGRKGAITAARALALPPPAVRSPW